MVTIIISCLTILCLIIGIIFFPNIKIKKVSFASFWLIALIGALLLIITQQISFPEIIDQSIKGAVNPIQILVLFISVTTLSVVLDEVGFFHILAEKATRFAKGSQTKFFILLYVLVSILTIFTSNDIIILTFTPFICAFARRTNINPIPYLVSQFVAANTWSLMLIIGNPTNIFISLSYDITFMEYFKIMLIPAIVAGLTSFIVLFLIFKKQLKKTMEVVPQVEKKYDKLTMIVALTHLGLCTLMLAISSWINLDMWLICLGFACSISIFLLIKDRVILRNTWARAPWNLIPFLLSMFIIVLALDKHQVMADIGKLLINISGNSELGKVFVFGTASIFADNLINNIPMSLASISVLGDVKSISTYAVIIGSNIGAYLTPIGALAGIMWMNILKKENVKFSFASFMKYGFMVVPLVGITSFLALYLIL